MRDDQSNAHAQSTREARPSATAASRWLSRLFCLMFALIGAGIGAAFGGVLAAFGILGLQDSEISLPAPHIVPKYPGGTALALVMVDDVIHERFFRYGSEYYKARNELSRQAIQADAKIAAGKLPSPDTLQHMDDLAVGLDMIGEHEEAIPVDRRKLELIRPIEEDWTTEVKTSHKVPVAFDEPVLGICGMWMLGGGANPFFAMTLGEIMARVGENEIAWAAYRRALSMSERYSSDETIRDQFELNCRERMESLEWEIGGSSRSAGTVQRGLEERYERELARGLEYRSSLEEFERVQIAAGARVDDPNFYEPFHVANRSPATAVRRMDGVRLDRESHHPAWRYLPAPLLLAGLFSMLGVVSAEGLLRLFQRPRRVDPDLAD